MELIKKLFKDDDTVIGLCSLKKQTKEIEFFIPKFDTSKSIYRTNYDKNIFVL